MHYHQQIDWGSIGTFVASVTALFIAIFKEWLESLIFKPGLRIYFENRPVYGHRTVMDFHVNDSITGKLIGVFSVPVDYFSFLVINEGKKQAKDCEVVLEEVSKKNEQGIWIKEEHIPTNLKWVWKDNPQFVSINPGRRIYCNIGHILKLDSQEREPSHWRFMPSQDKGKPIFMLELMHFFYWQRDCFVPGEYKIKIVVYSENAKRQEKTFKIEWTGNWAEKEEAIFREEIKIN